VLIEHDRVARVAPGGTQQAARIVDVTGRFVIPGLVDMHAHPMENKDPAGTLALMLAHGITGFRQMSGSASLLQDSRLPDDAPRMLARPGDLLTPFTAGSAAQAVRTVRRQHEQGADFIKAGLTTAPAFYAAQAEANRLGIPIVGHLPTKGDVTRISGNGMRSIEHLGGGAGLLACCSSEQARVEAALAGRRDVSVPAPLQPLLASLFRRALRRIVVNPVNVMRQPDIDIQTQVVETFDEDAAALIPERLRVDGTWQVPTLIRSRTMQLCDDPSFGGDPDLRYIQPGALRLWMKASERFGRFPDTTRETFASTNAVMLRLAKLMDDAGVRMLTGSDASGAAWVVPGAALHHEFDELAKAGLSPLRVLQMATSNAAEFLGLEGTMGTVEAGKTADLVVLDADPLSSVDHLHGVSSVVRAGRLYDAAALRSLRVRVAADRSAA
jgi:imidazolonepropionase-like amidohydrolase